MKKQLNSKGSTLVECIVAFAIFSLATVILMSGFLTAANLAAKASEVKDNSNKNIMGIETQNVPAGTTVTESDEKTISFKLGSVSYSSKGTYKTSLSGNLKLKEFVSVKADDSTIFIPDTDKPVNGGWPLPEEFPYSWSEVHLPYGTTFVYDGIFYIVATKPYMVVNMKYGQTYPTPTNGGWDWLGQNNNLIEITYRPVIQWNGGSQVDFYNATGGHITKGDKVFWNGDYYVFTVKDQTWAMPPNLDQNNWVKIKYPFS